MTTSVGRDCLSVARTRFVAGVNVVVSQAFDVSGSGDDHTVFDLLDREYSTIVISHDWAFAGGRLCPHGKEQGGRGQDLYSDKPEMSCQ